MSQYSDFFGVASAGGGIPVNSYIAFSVTADQNPTGYDEASGLYTHPDGGYYLRTGFTLSGSAAAQYPNATELGYALSGLTTTTGLSGFVGSPTPLGSTGAVTIDSDKVITYANQPSGTIVQESSFSTGGPTAKTISTSGFPRGQVVGFDLGYDWESDVVFLFGLASGQVRLYARQYTTDTLLNSYTYYNPPTDVSIYGIASIDPSKKEVFIGYGKFYGPDQKPTYDVIRYQSGYSSNPTLISSTTSSTAPFSTGVGGFQPPQVTGSGTFQVYSNVTRISTEYSGSDLSATGTTFDWNVVTTDSNQRIFGMRFDIGYFIMADATTNTQPYKQVGNFAGTIGDANATSDSVTGKPYFIKIG